MSSRRGSGSDPVDLLIGWYLKRWVERYAPPHGGRERLLQAAAVGLTPQRAQVEAPPALLVRFGRLLNLIYTWPWHGSISLSTRPLRFAEQTAVQSFLSGTGIFSLIS
jgi:hypothetical protein